MELLRRSLLLGCMLSGLWLLRLASLDPLVVISSVAEADAQRLAGQGRSFRASGPAWDGVLREIDALAQGGMPTRVAWRASAAPGASGGHAFFRTDEDPIGTILDELAIGRGTTYVSAARPAGDRYYKAERLTWSRQDFRLGAGFTGQPAPPPSLLYPFQNLAFAIMLAGGVLFVILPSPTRREGPMTALEMALLAAVLLLFAVPLFAVGGSVQALTRGLWLTIPCWALGAFAMHLFAAPGRNAHPHLFAAPGDTPEARLDSIQHPLFVRIGAAFLAVAVGPPIALVMASMALWNR